MRLPVFIDKNEVLRCLGYRGSGLSDALDRMIDGCIAEAKAAVRPLFIFRVFPVVAHKSGLSLAGASLVLPGESIRRHLSGCESCALLAATLGSGFDALIRTEQARDMSRAAVFDSCGSVAIESACDAAEEEIRKLARTRGLYLTDRFSPGYGDLPLFLQKELCGVLDTERKIGLTVTESFLLLPQKSVTAVIGLSDAPQPKRCRGCAFCDMAGTCPIKKDGKTCAE